MLVSANVLTRRGVRTPGDPATADLREVHLDRDANLRGSRLAAETSGPEGWHDQNTATPLPGDVDEPKTKNSKRMLALGALTERFKAWIAKQRITKPDDEEEDRTKPMRDSGVRKALKIAAVDADCDFLGFGLHSFRRANITWRQEVGGSAIEASKIAGHANVSMTGDYTIVQLQRQDELTRAIQGRMADAKTKQEEKASEHRGESVAAA